VRSLLLTTRRAKASSQSNSRSGSGLQSLSASLSFCPGSFASVGLALFLSVVYLSVLFQTLGTTAEDFFSPSLEQFSVQLHLPPRFAGVTLLALGNGAADVSATISAILSSPDGYLLSLGALTGAGMFVSCVVTSLVILHSDGVACRGALVRDISALAVCVVIVGASGLAGEFGMGGTMTFLGVYGLFVSIVLAADIYHRKVVLPRLREMAAQGLAGGGVKQDVSFFDKFSNYYGDEDGWEGGGVVLDSASDEHVNYELMESFEIDPDGGGEPEQPNVYAATNLKDGVLGCLEELQATAKGYVSSNFTDPSTPKHHKLNSLLLLPFTALRFASVPLTAPEEYGRGSLFLSTLCWPFWVEFYALWEHDTVLGWGTIFFMHASAAVAALLVARHCPVRRGDDPLSPPMVFAVPLAILGFVIAATWIDFVADQLVAALQYVGVVLHIPSAVLGLTVLAWGNSVGDLSTNISMAKRGLGNMSITACFAGPVFNFLVGLGVGLHLLANKSGVSSVSITFGPAIWAGLAFMLLNCVMILAAGLVRGEGFIPKEYAYLSLAIYVVYLLTCLGLEFGGV